MTSAPRSPGVYIMRDEQGKVIYVGKANDLKAVLHHTYRQGYTADGAVFNGAGQRY